MGAHSSEVKGDAGVHCSCAAEAELRWGHGCSPGMGESSGRRAAQSEGLFVAHLLAPLKLAGEEAIEARLIRSA